jgi:type IV fimbrial biogenesis protein FimT
MQILKRIPTDSKTRSHGLTVVELLIVITAIAIVILLAVPGSSVALEYYRLKSASENLIEGLNLAKGESLIRNSTVKVCPSSNGRFCRSDGNWSDGWLVYSDGNADGTVDEIELIQAYKAPNEHVSITASGAVTTVAAFTIAGLSPDHDSQSGEFRICHSGAKSEQKIISIDAEGWVRMLPSGQKGCSG